MSMTEPCSKCGEPYEPRCWQVPVGDEWWCADCVWQKCLNMEKEIDWLKEQHQKNLDKLADIEANKQA
jgi:hypothetical protein